MPDLCTRLWEIVLDKTEQLGSGSGSIGHSSVCEMKCALLEKSGVCWLQGYFSSGWMQITPLNVNGSHRPGGDRPLNLPGP